MNATCLISLLTARGVELVIDGDNLRFRPVEKLCPEDVENLRRRKMEVVAILRNEACDCPNCGTFIPYPKSVAQCLCEGDTPRPSSADRKGNLSSASSADRLTRVLSECDRCGSASFVDVSIHDGLSLRRDCGKCGRFLGWPHWNGGAE